MSARTLQLPACLKKAFALYVVKTAGQPVRASAQLDVGYLESMIAVHMGGTHG